MGLREYRETRSPGLEAGVRAEPGGAQPRDTVPCRAARRRPLPRRMRGGGRRGGKRAVPPRSAQPRRGRRAAPARARYGDGGQGRHGVPVPREGALGHGVFMTGSALAPGGLPETDVREEPPRPGYRGCGGSIFPVTGASVLLPGLLARAAVTPGASGSRSRLDRALGRAPGLAGAGAARSGTGGQCRAPLTVGLSCPAPK